MTLIIDLFPSIKHHVVLEHIDSISGNKQCLHLSSGHLGVLLPYKPFAMPLQAAQA